MNDACSTPMSSKDDAMETLKSVFDAARAGRGQLVQLSGKEGVGKYLLASDFADYCTGFGATVLTAFLRDPPCRPYGVWSQILRGVSSNNCQPGGGMSPLYQAVLARMNCHLFPNNAHTEMPPLPPEQTRYRVYDAVREFLLEPKSEQVLIILIDGMNWADDPSVDLLRYLLPFCENLPVLVLLVDDGTDARLSPILRQAGSDGSELSCQSIKLDGDGKTGDTWVKSVAPDIRQALANIAALGNEFDVADNPRLCEFVESATGGNFLRHDEYVSGRVQFRHAATRQAFKNLNDRRARQQIRRDAADKMRNQPVSVDRTIQFARLYHKTRDVADSDAGFDACLQAATQSRADSSPEMQYEFLLMARDFANDKDQKLSVLPKIALLASDLGDFKSALDAIAQAVKIYDLSEEGKDSALRLLAEMAQSLRGNGADKAIWSGVRDDALTRNGDQQGLIWAQLKLHEKGGLVKISGPPLEAGRWTGLNPQAVTVARELGTEQDFCKTLLVYDWYSKPEIETIVAMAESEWSSPESLAHVLSVATETLMYRHGAFDRACELLKQQLELHQSRGSIVEQAKSLVRLTMALLASGHLGEAIATRKKARDMVSRLGPNYMIYEHAGTKSGGDLYPEISMESNFAWFIGGDWLAVAEHWARATALVETGGSPVHIIEAGMAAQAYSQLGRFEDAKFYVDALTPVLHQLQPTDWGFNGAVGRASHAIWEMMSIEHATEYREFAHRLLAQGVGDWTNTSLELTVARMAALLGMSDEAQDYFARARTGLGDRTDDPRRGIVDYDASIAARISASKTNFDRNDLLDNASRIFAVHDMQPWLRRAETERSKSP